MNARENVGTLNYPMLLGGTAHAADTEGVVIRAGQGTIARGTVLAYSVKNDDYVILGTEASDGETLVARKIAAEDVTVDEASATTTLAYRSGDFIRESLIVKDGYSLTSEDIYHLEQSGIYLNNAITD